MKSIDIDLAQRFLVNSALFRSSTEEQIRAVASNLKLMKWKKDDILMKEGDSGDSLMILREGMVKLVLTNKEEGKEVILSILEAPEYFGEMALFDRQDRSCDVVALTDCSVYSFNRSAFIKFVARHPHFVIGLIQTFSQRMRAADMMISSLALTGVHERIAKLLLCHVDQEELERGHEVQVRRKMTHQNIANMVGASREMVTRVLKKMSKGGYIKIEKKEITILKPFDKNDIDIEDH